MKQFCPSEARRTATSRHRYGVQLDRGALVHYIAFHSMRPRAVEFLREEGKTATFWFDKKAVRDSAAELAVMLTAHHQGRMGQNLSDCGVRSV